MPLIQLVSMIEAHELALLDPSCWPDKAESGWSNKLFSKDAPMHGVHARAACFTRESYSEALWHVYARSSPVVRVRLKLEGLLRSCSQYKDMKGKFYLGDVRYKDSIEMKQVLEETFPKGRTNEPHSSEAATLFLLKRRAFAYEREVRLIWLTREPVDVQVRIPIDISSIINQILVSPYTQEWVVDAIKSLINKTYGFSWSIEKSSLDRAPAWMSSSSQS